MNSKKRKEDEEYTQLMLYDSPFADALIINYTKIYKQSKFIIDTEELRKNYKNAQYKRNLIRNVILFMYSKIVTKYSKYPNNIPDCYFDFCRKYLLDIAYVYPSSSS